MVAMQLIGYEVSSVDCHFQLVRPPKLRIARSYKVPRFFRRSRMDRDVAKKVIAFGLEWLNESYCNPNSKQV